jgi:hypothetical protein
MLPLLRCLRVLSFAIASLAAASAQTTVVRAQPCSMCAAAA